MGLEWAVNLGSLQQGLMLLLQLLLRDPQLTGRAAGALDGLLVLIACLMPMLHQGHWMLPPAFQATCVASIVQGEVLMVVLRRVRTGP